MLVVAFMTNDRQVLSRFCLLVDFVQFSYSGQILSAVRQNFVSAYYSFWAKKRIHTSAPKTADRQQRRLCPRLIGVGVC